MSPFDAAQDGQMRLGQDEPDAVVERARAVLGQVRCPSCNGALVEARGRKACAGCGWRSQPQSGGRERRRLRRREFVH